MNNNNNEFLIKKQKKLIIIRILMYGLLIFLISVIAYSNSLEGDFCFDDQFAIVGNKDVIGYTDDEDDLSKLNIPNTVDSFNSRMDDFGYGNGGDMDSYYNRIKVSMVYFQRLLSHDFWGQDITKIDSHKSYRPLTTLSFRFNFLTSGNTLDPQSFHLTNVLLHCIISIYIFFLSLIVFVPTFKRVYGSDEQQVHDKSMVSYLIDLLGIDEFSSFLASLLFTLHPVHTEAVSGIVGRAELLCTFFLMISLFSYFKCCNPKSTNGQTNWKFFIISIITCLMATLSKETGFSLIFILPITDILIVQYPLNKKKSNGSKALIPNNKSQWIIRTALIGLVGIGFLYVRKLITIDMVLDNFRLLENPIARESVTKTRLLSLANLHSRYLWLLIFPLNLSADWSFNCIPLIKDYSNILNVFSVLSYITIISSLIICCIKIDLFSILNKSKKVNQKKKYDDDDDDDHQQEIEQDIGKPEYYHSILWCLLFGIISFLPSSNIFFYVGTSIGERLLYIPSIAYCLLLARFLTLPLIYLSNDYKKTSTTITKSKVEESKSDSGKKSTTKKRYTTTTTQPTTTTIATTTTIGQSIYYKIYKLIMVLVIVLVLSFYSVRTWNRDQDWKSEESLFKSAAQVCPTSAKVQYNLGILYRRTKEWDKSIECFDKAKSILPDYCDVDYFYALTLINKNGNYNEAKPYLLNSMSCRHTQVKSLDAVNQIMTHLMDSNPDNPIYYSDWAYFEKDLQPVSSAMHYHKAGLIYNNRNDKVNAVKYLKLSLSSLESVKDSMFNVKSIDQDKKVIQELYCQDHIWLSACYFDLKNNEKCIDSLNKVYGNCRQFNHLWNEGLLSLVNIKLLKLKQDTSGKLPSVDQVFEIQVQMSEIQDQSYKESSIQFLAQYAKNYESVDKNKSILLYQKLLSLSPNSNSYYNQLSLLRLSAIYQNLNQSTNFKKYSSQLNISLINDNELRKLYSELNI